MNPNNFRFLVDPMKFKNLLWPEVSFYDKQREIVYSVMHDDETVVPAANMMGKDFIAAFTTLWFFITRPWFNHTQNRIAKHGPCRVVTSSAKDEHLIVLWGEMKNFISTSRIPLTRDRGGPLVLNHREIFWELDGQRCELSYIKGMVASDESIASLGGHHIANVGDGVPRTLWVNDESSSAKDAYKDMVDPWANRKLIIGNTYNCENFFKRAVKGDPKGGIPGGDIPRAYTPADVRRWEIENEVAA